jgi:hypothetical protein
MRLRQLCGGGLGSLLLVSGAIAGCSVRVGSSTESAAVLPSACARLGDERKMPFGAGATSFSLVWDSDHYVVAYSDPSMGNGDIYVARLAADGSLAGSPVVVDATPAVSDLPNLLKTRSGYLVAWQEGTAGKAVVARALGPDATPVGAPVAIASTQSSQSRPVLSHAPGGGIAIAWMDSFQGKGAVQVALLDASLKMMGPQRVAPNDVDGWPWIAGDDTTLAAVWSDKTGGPYDVHFATLDPASLATSAPSSLRGRATHDALLPRMVRTSFGFLAAWEDMRGADNQIYMALVDPGGKLVGGGLVEEPNSGDANWPNVAWTGDQAGIVYYQWRDNRPQIFMSLVDQTGARVRGLKDVQVSNGASGWSKYPDVAWNGSQFAVMYVDDRDGAPALWFQRVSCGM